MRRVIFDKQLKCSMPAALSVLPVTGRSVLISELLEYTGDPINRNKYPFKYQDMVLLDKSLKDVFIAVQKKFKKKRVRCCRLATCQGVHRGTTHTVS